MTRSLYLRSTRHKPPASSSQEPDVSSPPAARGKRTAASQGPKASPVTRNKRTFDIREPIYSPTTRGKGNASSQEPKPSPVTREKRTAAAREPGSSPMTRGKTTASSQEPKPSLVTRKKRTAAARVPDSSPTTRGKGTASSQEPKPSPVTREKCSAATREPDSSPMTQSKGTASTQEPKPSLVTREKCTAAAAREPDSSPTTRVKRTAASKINMKENASPKQTPAKGNVYLELRSSKEEDSSKQKHSGDDISSKNNSSPHLSVKNNVTPHQLSFKKTQSKCDKENRSPKQKTFLVDLSPKQKPCAQNVPPKLTSPGLLSLETERGIKDDSGSKDKGMYSPVRKSSRFSRSFINDRSKPIIKPKVDRSVLCDKTNSSNILCNKPKYDHISMITTVENKNNILSYSPKPNSLLVAKENNGNQNHVPIYKAMNLLTPLDNKMLPPEKKEEVYEFEVDENEEPVRPKKRKKRAYTRKPKMGPKALTINNIKYSSSESLVSLPERPVRRNKRPKKGANIKPYSSAINLNENEDTCSSVSSFMSHPPSMLLCGNSKPKSKFELSVLQETQAELTQSPGVPHEPSPQPPATPSHITPAMTSISHSDSRHSHFSPNPRCYHSKSNRSSVDGHNTPQHTYVYASPHISLCLGNNSTTSSNDFLSSTPCKRTSQVVRDNSVFEESCAVPQNIRASMGFIKSGNASSLGMADDKYFGFDEPEELEEPLVSPIKSSIDLQPQRPLVRRPLGKFPWEVDEEERPKPTIQEVIDLLKAKLLQVPPKESEVFDDTTIENNVPPSPSEDVDATVTSTSFKKPPRRSYERQRRVRYHSETEEDSEGEDHDKENREQAKHVVNKFYKKINTTKSAVPRVTKAQKRIAKEEEEMERLAAEMNAKFEEIGKTNLIVE